MGDQVLNGYNRFLERIKQIAEKYELNAMLDEVKKVEESGEEVTRDVLYNLIGTLYNIIQYSCYSWRYKNDKLYDLLPDDFKELLSIMDDKSKAFTDSVNGAENDDDFKKATGQCLYSMEAVLKYMSLNPIVTPEPDNNPKPNDKPNNGKDDKKSSIKKWFKENGKALAYIGGVVVVGGIIIACATKCSNNPNNNVDKSMNDADDKPGAEDTVKPGTSAPSTDNSANAVAPVEEISDLEYATLRTYENWSNITDKYTVDDVREVVKALNGLESSISVQEADDVLTDVIEAVVGPKFDSRAGIGEFGITGLKEESKLLNLNSLIIDRNISSLDAYLNSTTGMMNSVMNALIIGENEVEYAKTSLRLELDVLANNKLEGATPVEKILFSRMAIYTNMLAAPLSPSEAYDTLADSLEDVAVEAMTSMNGLSR